jgi:general secretion pathway protein C
MNKTQLSKVFWAIKISLVLTIVYVTASAVVVPLRLAEPFKPKAASGREPVDTGDSTVPEPQTPPDYSVIANSSLFGDSEPAPTASTVQTSMQAAQPQGIEEDLGLKLVGTIVGGPDVSRAIIMDTKAKITNPYKIVETIASATIESIERDKVVLRYRGRTRTLLLSTDTTVPPMTPTDGNGVRSSAVAAAPSAAQTSLSSPGRLGQVEMLFHQATIDPYIEKGQAEGLRITGLESIPIAATFGLKNGDVIQNVNGQVLTSKQKAFQVLQKAKTQSKINMQLLRDGKVTDLSFNVR